MLCKIWGFQGSGYEECRLLRYKTPVRTSQETPYISITKLRRLMLCKIWSFHGSDYEEWCLLRYKTPVHTSQETPYISITELRPLMLCKIWSFHDGDDEECLFPNYPRSIHATSEVLFLLSTVSSLLPPRVSKLITHQSSRLSMLSCLYSDTENVIKYTTKKKTRLLLKGVWKVAICSICR
jgi:hypothetical protein